MKDAPMVELNKMDTVLAFNNQRFLIADINRDEDWVIICKETEPMVRFSCTMSEARQLRQALIDHVLANPPREYTDEEITDQFMRFLWSTIRYWETVQRPEWDMDTEISEQRHRMEGLVFSILAMLDGVSMGLPGFILAPSVAPEDQEFHQRNGENWYPDNNEAAAKLRGVLSGGLHEVFYNYRPEKER